MDKLKPEAITLSIYDKNAREFGVTWQTSEKGSPILEYTDESDTDFSRSRRVKAECADSTGTVKNFAVIRGIAPGEKCRWRVGDESGIYSDPAIMRAPDHNPNELTFFIMTDTQDDQNNGEWWPHVWRDALRRFPEGQFLVHTGDIVQWGGHHLAWKAMTQFNEEFFRSIPMAPTSGNHDYWYGYLDGYDSVTEKHFNIDLPPQDTRHGIYYSFDCGPVHFTVLSTGDSMENDGGGLLAEQYEWALKDISATDKPWKVVSVHNPLYSPGKYGSRDPIFGVALSLREQFNEFFVKAGVDLVLCGHDHVFARTYPISGDGLPVFDYKYENMEIDGITAKVAVDPPGPIHLESGCAGNQNRSIIEDITEEFACCFEEMSNMTRRAVAYSAVRVKGDLLTVSYRENSVETGECVKHHAFGIRKSGIPKQ